VIVTPLLVGTDGAIKMSKSKGNYIGVTDPPRGTTGMFGKIMSLPDSLLEMYFTLLTDEPAEVTRSLIQQKPRDAKVKLAKQIIAWLHDQSAADAAEAEFTRTTHGGLPDDMPQIQIGPGPHKLPPLLVKAGLTSSNGEGVRKIKEGAVKIDGEKVSDFQKEFSFDKPVVLQLGNRKFAKLIP
jgi:tyrosyl-tRNA synthetase